MSRKHFKAIAEIISNISDKHIRASTALDFVIFFKQENKRFQADKFLIACGLEAK